MVLLIKSLVHLPYVFIITPLDHLFIPSAHLLYDFIFYDLWTFIYDFILLVYYWTFCTS